MRYDKNRKCKTIKRGRRAHFARWDCLHETCTFLQRLRSGGRSPERIDAMGTLREKIFDAAHTTNSKTEESDWSDLLIVGGGRRIRTQTLHIRAGAVIKVWVYSAHKLQLLYVSFLTCICMLTLVECSDNKKWFCAAENNQQTLKMKIGRTAMTMRFKPRKRINNGEGLEVS